MDFKILATEGNIGFYKSCEVTEIFLHRKRDNAVLNFFTLVVFEEKPYAGFNQRFLCDRTVVDEGHTLGIQRYWLSITEAEKRFSLLKTENKWSADASNFSQFPKLKCLSKQYIPSEERNRINSILKNNFHSGSYTIEFFDESKSDLDFILKTEALPKYNKLCEKIRKCVPIDLSVARDRIGNFIFQFPINIVGLRSKALPSWDGVALDFYWHKSIIDIPDCLIQVESVFDTNYMGFSVAEYAKTSQQKVVIGNLDQVSFVKICRKEPNLILAAFSGTYIRSFNIVMGIVNPEPRVFEVDGKRIAVEIISKANDVNEKEKITYKDYIANNLYHMGKKQLEESLSFKQYKGGKSGGVEDLQRLIEQKDENGVYLWDPFLSSTDILKTLFYSKTAKVPLKAIGSMNDTVKKVYDKKGKSVADIIAEYKSVLDNSKHNNHLL